MKKLRIISLAAMVSLFVGSIQAQDSGNDAKNEPFWKGDKTWTWGPTSINGGAVWGNKGHLAGETTSPDIVAGAWWGCGPIDGTCADSFNEQLQHTGQDIMPKDAYKDAYMIFKTDGTLCKYGPDGEELNIGTYSMGEWHDEAMEESFSHGTLHTSEGAILWPWAINTQGYEPTEFDILYLSDESMILSYARPGTGAWSEATWWSFKSTDGVVTNPAFVSFENYEYNGVYYTCTSSTTCKVVASPTDYAGDIVIPDSIIYRGAALSVTSIDKEAFSHCYSLTSVKMPNSITSIGEAAFFGCVSLGSVVISQTVTSIEAATFGYCSCLTSIAIPASVNSIERNAFVGCEALKSIYIDDLEAWCNIDFNDDYSNPLENGGSLYLNDTLITNLTIPNNITLIKPYAFNGCSSLTSVVISDAVTSVGDYAFYGCRNLTSIAIPNSVTSIGVSAFYLNEALNSVYISDLDAWCNIDFHDYGSNPLYNGGGLYLNDVLVTDLVVPDSVNEIKPYAFNGCYSLTSVNIPSSVISIGEDAFEDCNSINSVYITDLESWCNIAFSNSDSNPLHNGCRLYLNKELVTNLVIPNTVSEIKQYAFINCSSLTSAEIPNSATSIGKYAFNSCYGLSALIIGKSVNSIGHDAFAECSRIGEITSLNSTPPSVESDAFDGVQKAVCILKVPEGSVGLYKTAKEWLTFWNIEGIKVSDSGGEEKDCATPTIKLEGGRLLVTSATEGSLCYTTITSDDFKSIDVNGPIALTGVYTVTAFAYAPGYNNSATSKATLIWINPELQSDGVISMEAKKAILIRSVDDAIVVNGLEFGEQILLYDLNGVLLESIKATGDEAVIGSGLKKGKIYIVQVGDKNAKIII